MNQLVVGADKSPFLDVEFSKSVLLIDDGPLIDALKIPPRRKVVRSMSPSITSIRYREWSTSARETLRP
jgi:hypothetical protein